MQHQKATVSFSFMFWVRIVHLELSFRFNILIKKRPNLFRKHFLEKSMMFFKLIIKLQNEKETISYFFSEGKI